MNIQTHHNYFINDFMKNATTSPSPLNLLMSPPLQDFTEFARGLHAFSLAISRRQARAIFDYFDGDGTGLLDIDEFISSLKKYARQATMEAKRRRHALQHFKVKGFTCNMHWTHV